jgi:hypothetical protein
MASRSELADGAELAEVLRIAQRAAAAWQRGKDAGDEHVQLEAAKLFDAARMRLRRLTRGTAR